MFFWCYLPVLKILALHSNACSQVLQFKLGNKLHLCNRFSGSCAFGYGWTSFGKPCCSTLKILVSGLSCLPAKDCSPHCRAAAGARGTGNSGPAGLQCHSGSIQDGRWIYTPKLCDTNLPLTTSREHYQDASSQHAGDVLGGAGSSSHGSGKDLVCVQSKDNKLGLESVDFSHC